MSSSLHNDTIPNAEKQRSALIEFCQFFVDNAPENTFTTVCGFIPGKSGAAFIEVIPANAATMAEQILRHSHDVGTNVYFFTGILGERPAPGKRGDEALTIGSNVLRVDLDIYVVGKTKEEAVEYLENFTPRPTIIWDTGRGIQAAWELEEFCTDKFRIKAINKWLEKEFEKYGADTTSDLARVLRAPFTFNYKTDPESPTRIIAIHHDRVYKLDDFGWLSPETFVYGEPVVLEDIPSTFLADIQKINKHIHARIFSEATAIADNAPTRSDGRVDRSRNDWFIACSLVTLGYTRGQIMAVLTHSTWLSGSRFQERKNYSYVNSTIQKAVGHIDGDSDQYFEGKRFVPERMMRKIIKSGADFLRLTGMDTEQVDGLWYFNDGVYRRTGVQFVREEVVSRLGDKWRSNYAEETIKFMASRRDIPTYSIYQEPIRHTAETCYINTLSGMLNVATGQLLPHDPNTISFMQLPVRYNPEATSGVIDSFIRQIIAVAAEDVEDAEEIKDETREDREKRAEEDAKDVEATINVFWEFVGYCLLQDCRFKKAMLLIGPRDTGKSTILDLLKRFLGQYNTISTSLQDICDARFDAANMMNRLANIYPDLAGTELKDSGKFKAMTSGDPIKGERKYEHAVSFYPTAKHIYSTNAHVPTKDPEVEAFVERWIIFKLQKTFHFTPQGDEDAANTRKIDELATGENLSEMLNLALAGLRRLLVQGGFSSSRRVTKATDEYHAMLDSVYAFWEATTEPDPDPKDGAFIPKAKARDAYVLWCGGGEDRYQLSGGLYNRRLQAILKKLGIREGRPKAPDPDGKRPEGWYGRKWKDGCEPKAGLTLLTKRVEGINKSRHTQP